MCDACLWEASLCLEAAERPQWPRVYSLDRPRSRDHMNNLSLIYFNARSLVPKFDELYV